MTTTWFCDLHRTTNTGDCPKCDDEQIAELERYAKLPVCHTCQRTLREGEQAWASDWTVIGPDGPRTETRYTCDPCDENALSGTYGACTGCGAIEANLLRPTGTRDLSGIGEHHAYPTGYGCEFCA